VLLYLPPLIAAWELHPHSKGLITGLVIGGYGLSSLFFNWLIINMINPNQSNPEFSPGESEAF